MASFVIKGFSPGGGFRALVFEGRAAVQEVVDAQLGELEGSDSLDRVAELFGEVLLSAILIRLEMSPNHRLQVSLRSEGGSLLADSHPDGMVRGVVSGRCPVLGPRTHMQVSRVLEDGQLHQGMVETAPNMSETLTQYMLQSEQVVSTAGLRVHVAAGLVQSARGFLVQMLPGASEEIALSVIDALEGLEPEWEIQEPDLLLLDILGGSAHFTIRSDVFAGCTCSEDSILGALATLSALDRQELSEAESALEISCQYCSKTYSIDPSSINP